MSTCDEAKTSMRWWQISSDNDYYHLMWWLHLCRIILFKCRKILHSWTSHVTIFNLLMWRRFFRLIYYNDFQSSHEKIAFFFTKHVMWWFFLCVTIFDHLMWRSPSCDDVMCVCCVIHNSHHEKWRKLKSV